jgi:hypothetical protein
MNADKRKCWIGMEVWNAGQPVKKIWFRHFQFRIFLSAFIRVIRG